MATFFPELSDYPSWVQFGNNYGWHNNFFIFSVRIGKKSKDGESKSQVIEAINRLICTSKSQNHSLKGKMF